MKYKKTAISISEQIERLKQRGLNIEDEDKASHYLGNISYYRLRAYTYPFQNNKDSNHPFIKEISFEEIISLYVFDRKLRLLLFNALEKLEIAFRTQIIYHYSLKYGAHWHLNPKLYTNHDDFTRHMTSLEKEINISKETFIKHYKKTYVEPIQPPAWMSLEVSSLGLLSQIFTNLKNNECKTEITYYFGLKKVGLLENWLRCLRLLRNICAHHGRVWNRRMTKIGFPRKPLNNFIPTTHVLPYKIYAYTCAIQYILNIISPGHSFKERYIELMDNCPLAQEKEMGFPKYWKDTTFWR